MYGCLPKNMNNKHWLNQNNACPPHCSIHLFQADWKPSPWNYKGVVCPSSWGTSNTPDLGKACCCDKATVLLYSPFFLKETYTKLPAALPSHPCTWREREAILEEGRLSPSVASQPRAPATVDTGEPSKFAITDRYSIHNISPPAHHSAVCTSKLRHFWGSHYFSQLPVPRSLQLWSSLGFPPCPPYGACQGRGGRGKRGKSSEEGGKRG